MEEIVCDENEAYFLKNAHRKFVPMSIRQVIAWLVTRHNRQMAGHGTMEWHVKSRIQDSLRLFLIHIDDALRGARL
jgi:hypothetical protein